MKIFPFKKTAVGINNSCFYQNNTKDTSAQYSQYSPLYTALPYEYRYFDVYFGTRNFIDSEISWTGESKKLKKIITEQQKSLGLIDIEKLVSEVQKASKASENEVLYSLNILTQYANMKNLDKMVKFIGYNYGCKDFFCTFDLLDPRNRKFNYGLALSYYQAEKEQLKLNPNGTKKAFVLDEMGLQYIENLYDWQRKQLMDTCVFINALGWEQGFNIFDQTNDISLFKNRTIELIKKVKEKQGNLSYEEAFEQELSRPYKERLEKCGITDIKTVSLTDFNPNISDKRYKINKIVNNITPEKITIKDIEDIVDTALSATYCNSDKMKKKVLKYLCLELDIYTPQRMGDEFKKIKERIDNKMKELGIEDNNVYYVLPNNYKSYIATAIHYLRVNNIDPSNIVFWENKKCDLKDNSVYVLLDDFIATGGSFNYYFYDCLPLLNKDSSYIFMCPMVSTYEGVNFLRQKIENKNRTKNDFVLIDEIAKKKKLEETTFFKECRFQQDEETSFEDFLNFFEDNTSLQYGALGQARFGFALSFPYMTPDNDAKFPSLIFERLLLNPKSDAALKNQCSSYIKSFYDEKMKEKHPDWYSMEASY